VSAFAARVGVAASVFRKRFTRVPMASGCPAYQQANVLPCVFAEINARMRAVAALHHAVSSSPRRKRQLYALVHNDVCMSNEDRTR